MRLSVFACAAAVFAFGPIGCIPNDQGAADPSDVQQTQQPAPAPAGTFGQAPPPAVYGNPPPPATGQYNPAPQPGPAPAPASAGGQATPIAPGMAVVASVPLQAMAGQEAPGMQPDGGAFAGQFQEGQTLEQPINLQPNKCYTIIGAAGPGIQELSIQLVTQPVPGMPPVPLAQSNNSAQPVLGGNKQCWRFMSPLGIPGKVLLKANKGAGMAAAEVFIK